MTMGPSAYAIIGGCAALLMIGLVFLWPDQADEPSAIPVESPERMERIRAMTENWPREPSYHVSFNPLNPQEEDRIDQSGESALIALPEMADGSHELVTAYCSGCHSLDIVIQQRASLRRWDELLVWMEEKQGMPAIPAEDKAKVLDYLGQNFGSEG